MALILSLDATTSVCSVALHREGELVQSAYNSEPRAAASRLAVMTKNLLEKAQVSFGEIAAVAVSSGPGSYTGLRIATSTAKGLCFALDVPLIAINSLLVLTRQLIGKVEADIFCPMVDARRMEVYCALISLSLEFITAVEAKVLDRESFRKELNESKIAFFGDGAEKFKRIANHNNAIFVDSIQPNAIELGNLAFAQFKEANFENLGSFEPYYLKDFMIKNKT